MRARKLAVHFDGSGQPNVGGARRGDYFIFAVRHLERIVLDVKKLERAPFYSHRRNRRSLPFYKHFHIARELFLRAHHPTRAIGNVQLHYFVSVARGLVCKRDRHVELRVANSLDGHSVVRNFRKRQTVPEREQHAAVDFVVISVPDENALAVYRLFLAEVVASVGQIERKSFRELAARIYSAVQRVHCGKRTVLPVKPRVYDCAHSVYPRHAHWTRAAQYGYHSVSRGGKFGYKPVLFGRKVERRSIYAFLRRGRADVHYNRVARRRAVLRLAQQSIVLFRVGRISATVRYFYSAFAERVERGRGFERGHMRASAALNRRVVGKTSAHRHAHVACQR